MIHKRKPTEFRRDGWWHRVAMQTHFPTYRLCPMGKWSRNRIRKDNGDVYEWHVKIDDSWPSYDELTARIKIQEVRWE